MITESSELVADVVAIGRGQRVYSPARIPPCCLEMPDRGCSRQSMVAGGGKRRAYLGLGRLQLSLPANPTLFPGIGPIVRLACFRASWRLTDWSLASMSQTK